MFGFNSLLRSLRVCGAASLLFAAASLSACAPITSPPTVMPTGAAAAQPIGAMLFCATNSAECDASASDDTVTVAMTDQLFDQLTEVQHEINRQIDPSPRAELIWHYSVGNTGNCVQYAMEKRRALIARGWPASALELATVTTRQGVGHLVLIVKTSRGDLALDNLRYNVEPWQGLPYRWIARQNGSSFARWVSIGGTGA